MFEGIDLYYRVIPWAVLGTAALIVLLVFWKIWKRMVTKKVQSIGDGSAMSMMDVDRLRKKGLVSEEEHRRIRSALASREVERTRKKQRQEQERMLLSQVEQNPLAAYQLLELDQQAPAPPAARPRPVSPSAPPSAEEGKARQDASPPAMNMPRVVQARNEALTPQAPGVSSKPRDIDMLLEKGAITPEEYQRLKKFFE